MKPIRCNCRACRAGLRTRSGSRSARLATRAARRAAKQDLRAGREPPVRFSLGYTD